MCGIAGYLRFDGQPARADRELRDQPVLGREVARVDAAEFLFADLVAVGAQHLEATLRRVRHRGRGLEVALGEMLEQLQRRRARAVGRARVLRENRSGGQQRRHQQEPHAAARSAPSPAS